MIPFMIVLMVSLIGFTMSYRALNYDGAEDLYTSAKINYRIMFGDFDTDDYNLAAWTFFIISSCMMTLIMLNMLIAIMGDTYGRVMGTIIPSDFQELNNMILEMEELLKWNKEKGEPQYLHYA